MQNNSTPDTSAYLTLIERAILELRMRIRYGEEVSLREVHDILQAIHNIPPMLRKYGGWYVEENVMVDLARYDEHWLSQPDSKMRRSLTETLERARRGEFEH